MDLKGRNAILTGASRGLGVYVARILAGEGVNLALAARSADELSRVRGRLVQEAGIEAIAVPTDVADPGQLQALADRAESELGPVDILVNNAGIEAPAAYAEYPPEEIETLIRVNLIGPMLLTRMILPLMLERGRGRIVNMASLAGKAGLPYEVPYATSKAGLITFTRALAAELHGSPVTCSVVCPGFVSDEGMYARIEAQGAKAPKAMGVSTPRKVAEAVLKAVREGPVELIVNPSPMRPLLAVSELFPGIGPHIHNLLGITDFSRGSARGRDELHGGD